MSSTKLTDDQISFIAKATKSSKQGKNFFFSIPQFPQFIMHATQAYLEILVFCHLDLNEEGKVRNRH